MLKVIVDSSIVIKWFNKANEEKVDEAYEVYKLLREKKIEAFAPDFILIEILNISFKKKHLPIKEIEQATMLIKRSGIVFKDFQKEDIPDLLKVMSEYSTTSYDAIYLLLAKQEKCKLLTADDYLLGFKDLTVSLDSFCILK